MWSVFFYSINAISGCIIFEGNPAFLLLIPRKDNGCSVGGFAALSLKDNTLRYQRTGQIVAAFTVRRLLSCNYRAVKDLKFRDYVVIDR